MRYNALGLEVLLIIIVIVGTKSMKIRRSLQILLIAGYFLVLFLTWSVTWRIPYRPNALLIDAASLGIPFAFWLCSLVFITFLTKNKKNRG
ncbi:MAG: hypothetical protein KQH63_09655 [Desulfobulbaceae bacterium]|nr:hypothetical protein [Desulfobulbaceae bacterium]